VLSNALLARLYSSKGVGEVIRVRKRECSLALHQERAVLNTKQTVLCLSSPPYKVDVVFHISVLDYGLFISVVSAIIFLSSWKYTPAIPPKHILSPRSKILLSFILPSIDLWYFHLVLLRPSWLLLPSSLQHYHRYHRSRRTYADAIPF
jgi:hypothetical protein